MNDLDKLDKIRDRESLVQMLRNSRASPETRLKAARALGKLDAVDQTEMLIRSFLEDPDEGVKKAAYTVLDGMLGSQTDQAIEAYNPPADDLKWLGDDQISKELDDVRLSTEPEETEIIAPDFDDLINSNDTRTLAKILRSEKFSADVRADAADALGDLDAMEEVETLIGASLYDPELIVKNAAYGALDLMIGSQTDQAIQTYRVSHLEDTKWLLDDQDEIELGQVHFWTSPGGSDLEIDSSGLALIINTNKDPVMRRKAIAMVKRIPDIGTASMLAFTASEDEDESVRIAARNAIEEIFPGETDKLIQRFQDTGSPFDDSSFPMEETDVSQEDQSEGMENEENPKPLKPISRPLPTPVIEELKTPIWIFILGGIIILALVVFLLFK